MPAGAGERMMLGIAIEVDASGVIQGVSIVEREMDRVERRADQADRRNRELARGAQQGLHAAAGVATAMGASALAFGEVTRRGLLQPMITESENFEVEMSQLQFVSNATGEELERLRNTAIQTGLATQFSPAQAASALRMLRAAGLDAQTTYESLNAVLDVATASAGTLDLATAASAVAASLNKMRGQGENARQMMDSFAEATRNTNLQFENLPVIVNAIGDLAQRFRMTSTEVFAMGGIMRSTGQLSAQSGQALRIMGDRLIQNVRRIRMARDAGRQLSPTLQNIERAMETFNIRVFDSNDALRPMVDIIADVADGLANARTDADRMTLQLGVLGPRGSAVVSAMQDFQDQLTGLTGGAGIRALVNRLREANGTSRDAAAAFENTARGLRVFIEGTVQTILIILGEALAPAIRTMMEALRGVLNRFLELIQANPMLARVLSYLTVGFIVFSFIMGTTLIALAGLLFLLSSLIPIVTAGASVLTGFVAVLGGIAAAVLAVVAVFGSFFILLGIGIAAAIMAYRRNLGGFKDFIDDWVTDLRLIWSALVDFFQSDDESLSAAIVDQLEERGLLDTTMNILAFTRRVEEVWNGVKDVIVPTIGVIVSAMELWLETVIFVVDTIEEGLVSLGFRFDENMSMWRTLGQVVGVAIVVLSILTFVVLGALASVLVVLAGLWFLQILPILFIIAMVALSIAVFIGLIMAIRWVIRAFVDFAIALGEALENAGRVLADWLDGVVEWGGGVIDEIANTAEQIWEPFQEFGRRVGVFWSRLTAADAPWRRWAEPWFERNVNQPIIQPIRRAFTAVGEFLSNVWTSIVSAATTIWTTLTSWLSTAWTAISTFFVGLAQGIASVFVWMWDNIVAGFNAAIGWISQLLEPIVSAVVSAGEAIATFFSGLWDSISTFFTDLIDRAATWGSQLVDTVLGGIQERWSNLVGWISENIVEVRDLLPGSNAKTGPLSDLSQSGAALITTFLEGAQAAFPNLTTTISQGLGALGFPTTVEGAAAAVEGGIGTLAQVASPVTSAIGAAVGTVTGGQSVTVTIGEISVAVQQATPEEAERLAEMIMERIQSSLENEGEATFA